MMVVQCKCIDFSLYNFTRTVGWKLIFDLNVLLRKEGAYYDGDFSNGFFRTFCGGVAVASASGIFGCGDIDGVSH